MLNLTGLPNYHGKTNGQSKLKKIIGCSFDKFTLNMFSKKEKSNEWDLKKKN